MPEPAAGKHWLLHPGQTHWAVIVVQLLGGWTAEHPTLLSSRCWADRVTRPRRLMRKPLWQRQCGKD
eukprot:2970279-Amphidinium_carterae.2